MKELKGFDIFHLNIENNYSLEILVNSLLAIGSQ
jgi:hypothetical protein